MHTFCTLGNTFYLVMPTEQGESFTEDLNDPPTPTGSHSPQTPEEVIPPQTHPEEETPICGAEPNQSEAMQLEQEEEMGRSQAGHQSHVIKNVDEIFHTIEGLMSKLRQLKVSLSALSWQQGGCVTVVWTGLMTINSPHIIPHPKLTPHQPFSGLTAKRLFSFSCVF